MKQIIKVISILIVILFLFIILNPNPRFKIDENVTTKDDGNQTLNLTLEATKHLRPIDLESVTLQVSHKYNKSINEIYDLVPYAKGKYSFFYNPTEPGEYTFTFTITCNSKEYIKTTVMTFDSA